MKLDEILSGRKIYFLLLCLALIILFLQIKSLCSPHLESNSASPSKPSQISSEHTYLIDSFASPLIYHYTNNEDGQISFESVITDRLKVKLIPNNKTRQDSSISSIDNILGVTHFFLDLDLSSHFVHDYTNNFFRSLRPTDFVLKYEKSDSDSQIGVIHYLRKNEIDSTDKLGYTLAFFRQWRLSEFNYRIVNGDIELYMNPCSWDPSCCCPQVIQSSSNPFPREILIWNQQRVSGYSSLSNFRKLSRHNGGTVVIIWEDTSMHKILFCDIHGSTYDIISKAIEISKKYKVDPSISISDAGPMANKFMANSEHILNCTQIESLLSFDNVGAGFGYVPQKIYKYVTLKNGKLETFQSFENTLR